MMQQQLITHKSVPTPASRPSSRKVRQSCRKRYLKQWIRRIKGRYELSRRQNNLSVESVFTAFGDFLLKSFVDLINEISEMFGTEIGRNLFQTFKECLNLGSELG
jgi:hypothetical protein